MVDILVVLSYLILTLVIGIYSARGIETMRDFAIGERRYPTSVLVATLFATFVGGNSTIGFAGKGYSVGFTFMLVSLGWVVPYILTAFLISPRIEKFLGMISVGDMMEQFYGKPGRYISGLMGTMIGVGSVGAQILALGYFFHYLMDVPHLWGVLIGAGIVITYSTFGGIKAVTTTDVVQFGVLIVAIPIILNMGLRHVDGYTGLFSLVPQDRIQFFPDTVSTPEYIALFCVNCFLFMEPAFIQRLLMAKNGEQSANMMKITGVVGIPFLIIVGLIGMIAFAIEPNLDSSVALPYLIKEILPMGVKGLAVAGILAVIMSTADSLLNSACINFVHDLVKPFRKNSLTDKQELGLARIMTVVFGCGAIIAALQFKNIVDMILGVAAFWAPIVSLPLAAGILGARARIRTFLLSAAVGAGTYIIWQSFNLQSIFEFDGLAPSILANAVAFFGSHYFLWRPSVQRPPQPEGRAPFQRRPQQAFYPMRRENTEETMGSLKEKEPLLERFLNISRVRVEEYGAQYGVFGIFAVLNYILPYFMWSHITPHNYDVFVTLRIVAGAMCFLLIMHVHWPRRFMKYQATYWHFTLMLCLPFMSMYMFLDSHASLGWLLNVVLAIFLLAILVDWMSFMALFSLGSFLGYLLFLFQGGEISHIELSEEMRFWGVYVVFFATLIGLVFSRNKERMVIERFDTLRTMSGAIAHEMRTPMAAVGFSVKTLTNCLPKLLKVYERAEKDTSEVIEARALNSLLTLPDRLKDTSRKAQNVIDMLLVKIKDSNNQEISICSARACLKEALEKYPFSERERALITVEDKGDFPFKGNQEIFVHVLFNLIKNALYQIKVANKGDIKIVLAPDKLENLIYFTDTGPGIPKWRQPFIFEKFYSKTKYGTGIGLAFCKEVMRAIRGDILCESKEGEYTKFTIVFSTVESLPDL